ncbi:hypothetical protein BCR34DRAFT_597619 [Clohesyomyces aquaticus]|uniref:BTB domain-containing protein n=1 Tax=Clohesyomyces aquaticus TaxID=1231657 RepID=A0A1Y2A2D2_9PLEO|nr:hypothetical protein BCR34DRAFT_597619 [Clohesyomyces aquaticus]
MAPPLSKPSKGNANCLGKVCLDSHLKQYLRLSEDECRKVLSDSFEAFLSSGDYSDFTITCRKRTWKEAQNSTITLVDDDPDVVGSMLEYLCTGNVASKPLERT